jgi:hypothetical protein
MLISSSFVVIRGTYNVGVLETFPTLAASGE